MTSDTEVRVGDFSAPQQTPHLKTLLSLPLPLTADPLLLRSLCAPLLLRSTLIWQTLVNPSMWRCVFQKDWMSTVWMLSQSSPWGWWFLPPPSFCSQSGPRSESAVPSGPSPSSSGVCPAIKGLACSSFVQCMYWMFTSTSEVHSHRNPLSHHQESWEGWGLAWWRACGEGVATEIHSRKDLLKTYMKVCTDSSITVTVNVIHQDHWVKCPQTVCFLLLINKIGIF